MPQTTMSDAIGCSSPRVAQAGGANPAMEGLPDDPQKVKANYLLCELTTSKD